ncbi:hypothetical protein BX666DRAFT_1908120 [Dichotomocladium elegans]|nr:hypothetical protein BX666DRAFT_1908120 [Dichotomocladium elegans]
MAATTTTTIKSKRFSFGGFFSRSKAPSPAPATAPAAAAAATAATEETLEEKQPHTQQAPPEPAQTPKRRTQKTQSLYIKSFRSSIQQQPNTKRSSQYDPTEAHQSNHKEVKSQIRRSLSAVLYATPQKLKQSNEEERATHRSSMQLVPVLVTQDLSDLHGGMIMPEESVAGAQENEKKKTNPRAVEYDNTLDISKDKEGWMIVWQGYGYWLPIQSDDEQLDNNNTLFEKEIWKAYRGLIHPLHLVKHDDEGRWAALDVTELKRYFDNYGSMLLRLRESSMKRQQLQYQTMDNIKSEWIIPQKV